MGLVCMLAWLSPEPDHCSLSYIFLNLLLTVSLSVPCGLVLQGLRASYWWDLCVWNLVPGPGLWCQLLKPVGSQDQLWEQVEVFNLQPLEREWCVLRLISTIKHYLQDVKVLTGPSFLLSCNFLSNLDYFFFYL